MADYNLDEGVDNLIRMYKVTFDNDQISGNFEESKLKKSAYLLVILELRRYLNLLKN